MTLIFNEVKVNEVVQDFKKIKLQKYQKDLVGKIAMLMKGFLPLSLMAIKGSMWIAIKQWQVKHEMTVADLPNMPPAEKMESVIELIQLGRDKMSRMLVNPEEQSELLKEVFEKATQVAMKGMKK